jgi:hypothetical protein
MSKLLKAIQAEVDRLDAIVMQKGKDGFLAKRNSELKQELRDLAKLEYMESTLFRLYNFTEFNLRLVSGSLKSVNQRTSKKEQLRWELRYMMATQGYYTHKTVLDNKVLARFGTHDNKLLTLR